MILDYIECFITAIAFMLIVLGYWLYQHTFPNIFITGMSSIGFGLLVTVACIVISYELGTNILAEDFNLISHLLKSHLQF